MTEELSSFIDKVYRQPYSLLRNNCIHKSLKIKTKAEELGSKVEVVWCLSIVPMKKWRNFPSINFHMYTVVDGQKVDVSLDPLHEALYCQNSEKKLVLPVNVSRVRRALHRIFNRAEVKEKNVH